MHRPLLAAAIALTVSVQDADAQDAKSERKCTPAVIDSVQFGSAPVYRDCDVDKPVKLKHEERPKYRLADGVQCARVEMLFVVDSSGKVVTGSATLVSTTEPEYAILLLASLDEWRFEPAKREKAPVAQVVLVEQKISASSAKVPFTVGRITAEDRAFSPPPPTQNQAAMQCKLR